MSGESGALENSLTAVAPTGTLEIDLASNAPVDSSDPTWLLSRRQMIGGSAAFTLGAVAIRFDPDLHDAAGATQLTIDEVPHNAIVVVPAGPALHLTAERAEDLVLIDFTFYGFTVVKGPRFPSLVATTAKTNANWIGVVVQFPPQSIGEGDYSLTQKHPPPFDPGPVLSKLAGPSRLAFTFNHGDKIPLPTGKIDDLLDWSGWNLSVAPSVRTGSNYSTAAKPFIYQTAIECPLALFLSPVVDGVGSIIKGTFSTTFENRSKPFVSSGKVTECWTTSLSSIFRQIGPRGGIFSESIEPAVAPVWSADLGIKQNVPNATSETNIVYTNYIPPPP